MRSLSFVLIGGRGNDRPIDTAAINRGDKLKRVEKRR